MAPSSKKMDAAIAANYFCLRMRDVISDITYAMRRDWLQHQSIMLMMLQISDRFSFYFKTAFILFYTCGWLCERDLKEMNHNHAVAKSSQCSNKHRLNLH